MTSQKPKSNGILVKACFGVQYELEVLGRLSTEELRTIANCLDKLAAFGSSELSIRRRPVFRDSKPEA